MAVARYNLTDATGIFQSLEQSPCGSALLVRDYDFEILFGREYARTLEKSSNDSYLRARDYWWNDYVALTGTLGPTGTGLFQAMREIAYKEPIYLAVNDHTPTGQFTKYVVSSVSYPWGNPSGLMGQPATGIDTRFTPQFKPSGFGGAQDPYNFYVEIPSGYGHLREVFLDASYRQPSENIIWPLSHVGDILGQIQAVYSGMYQNPHPVNKHFGYEKHSTPTGYTLLPFDFPVFTDHPHGFISKWPQPRFLNVTGIPVPALDEHTTMQLLDLAIKPTGLLAIHEPFFDFVPSGIPVGSGGLFTDVLHQIQFPLAISRSLCGHFRIPRSTVSGQSLPQFGANFALSIYSQVPTIADGNWNSSGVFVDTDDFSKWTHPVSGYNYIHCTFDKPSIPYVKSAMTFSYSHLPETGFWINIEFDAQPKEVQGIVTDLYGLQAPQPWTFDLVPHYILDITSSGYRPLTAAAKTLNPFVKRQFSVAGTLPVSTGYYVDGNSPTVSGFAYNKFTGFYNAYKDNTLTFSTQWRMVPRESGINPYVFGPGGYKIDFYAADNIPDISGRLIIDGITIPITNYSGVIHDVSPVPEHNSSVPVSNYLPSVTNPHYTRYNGYGLTDSAHQIFGIQNKNVVPVIGSYPSGSPNGLTYAMIANYQVWISGTFNITPLFSSLSMKNSHGTYLRGMLSASPTAAGGGGFAPPGHCNLGVMTSIATGVYTGQIVDMTQLVYIHMDYSTNRPSSYGFTVGPSTYFSHRGIYHEAFRHGNVGSHPLCPSGISLGLSLSITPSFQVANYYFEKEYVTGTEETIDFGTDINITAQSDTHGGLNNVLGSYWQ